MAIESSVRRGIVPARVPTRAEVREKLAALAEGSLTPDEASDWAWPFEFEHGDVEDPVIDDGLTSLQIAEARISATEYLYGPLDFADWLAELDRLAATS